MATRVWIVGGSDGGGTGPEAALDHSWQYIMPSRVRWSSPYGDGAEDGPERRLWIAERQRSFDATVDTVGLKVGGRWWSWWPSFWLT